MILQAGASQISPGVVSDLAVFVAGLTQLRFRPGGRESLLVQVATVAPNIECLIIVVIPQGLAKVAIRRSGDSGHFRLLLRRGLPGADRAIRDEVLFCAIRFLICRSKWTQKTNQLRKESRKIFNAQSHHLPQHHNGADVHGVGPAATVDLEGLRECLGVSEGYELVDGVRRLIIIVIILEVLLRSRDRVVGVGYVDMPMQNMDSIRTSCHQCY